MVEARGKRVTQSFKVRPEIWRQAKIAAVKRNITLSELVETAILRQLRQMNADGDRFD
jgi:hypothetical protein